MLEVGNNLGRVLRGIDLEVGLGDFTLRVDQKGVTPSETRDKPVGVGAVAPRHVAVLVGEQRERQMVFPGELGVRRRTIDAHADDLRAERGELRHVVTKTAGFLGTARRIVLRVEIEHQPFAAQTVERNGTPALVGQGKRRRQSADRRHFVGPGQLSDDQPQQQHDSLEHGHSPEINRHWRSDDAVECSPTQFETPSATNGKRGRASEEWYPRVESNPYLTLRRRVHYPLCYEE